MKTTNSQNRCISTKHGQALLSHEMSLCDNIIFSLGSNMNFITVFNTAYALASSRNFET